jgi:hypothetical protein
MASHPMEDRRLDRWPSLIRLELQSQQLLHGGWHAQGLKASGHELHEEGRNLRLDTVKVRS